MTLDIPTVLHLTADAVDGIIRNAQKMPEDKLRWSPTPETRNAADLLHEVANAANWFAEAIETNDSTNLHWGYWQPIMNERAPENHTLADLEFRVRQAHTRFAQALENCTPAQLDVPIPGSEWSPTPRSVSFFMLRNVWYHSGQINYIQTCYGDFD